jgi:hypothetical protein
MEYRHDDGSITRAELLRTVQMRSVFLPLVLRNFETVPPVVVGTNPANGTTGVSRDLRAVSITFSEPMQGDRWSLSSWGGFDLSNQTPVSYDSVSYTFTFTRTTTTLLPANSQIRFAVNPEGYPGFVDISGNPAPTTLFSFTTGD